MIYVVALVSIANLYLSVIVYLQLKRITGMGIELPFIHYGDKYI
jgi:hypothetical protein